jgi:hypothetical protein
VLLKFFILSTEEEINKNNQIRGEEKNMAKKRVIPWELKYKYAMGGYAVMLKAFLYAIREKYGAAAVLEIYERISKMDDRVKNMTNSILTAFKLEGNDAETIGEWWDIWQDLIGQEVTILEQSKTIRRVKITKCPWVTEPEDISDWALIFTNIASKTINPKCTVERPKAMCAGDPYCEYIYKIEE